MTTQTEALKLALEAMELVNIEFVCNGAHHAKKDRHSLDEDCPVTMRYRTAITAIKEALAQTQEPVAWMDVDGKTFPFVWNVSSVQQGSKYLDETLTPLYTHSRRTWVGLTVEEVEKIWQGVEASDFHDCVQPFAQAIGNILKEKNFV